LWKTLVAKMAHIVSVSETLAVVDDTIMTWSYVSLITCIWWSIIALWAVRSLQLEYTYGRSSADVNIAAVYTLVSFLFILN
jgi:hypothetical protein